MGEVYGDISKRFEVRAQQADCLGHGLNGMMKPLEKERINKRKKKKEREKKRLGFWKES